MLNLFGAFCLLALSFGLIPPVFGDTYTIEGSIAAPSDAPRDWYVHTRIHVEGTQHVGFVRRDGTFEISDVSSGSFIVEPIHPTFMFQSARVDINSKGRMRARRVNAPQPNAVKEMAYPLRLMSMGRTVYFKPREQMRTMDLLLNPSVLYVLVPFLLVMVLTKLVNTNDPELQKELQQMNIQNQLPDMSELLSSMSLFGGGGKKKTIGAGSTGRRHTALGASASGSSGADTRGSAATSTSYTADPSIAAGRREKKRRTVQ